MVGSDRSFSAVGPRLWNDCGLVLFTVVDEPNVLYHEEEEA